MRSRGLSREGRASSCMRAWSLAAVVATSIPEGQADQPMDQSATRPGPVHRPRSTRRSPRPSTAFVTSASCARCYPRGLMRMNGRRGRTAQTLAAGTVLSHWRTGPRIEGETNDEADGSPWRGAAPGPGAGCTSRREQAHQRRRRLMVIGLTSDGCPVLLVEGTLVGTLTVCQQGRSGTDKADFSGKAVLGGKESYDARDRLLEDRPVRHPGWHRPSGGPAWPGHRDRRSLRVPARGHV